MNPDLGPAKDDNPIAKMASPLASVIVNSNSQTEPVIVPSRLYLSVLSIFWPGVPKSAPNPLTSFLISTVPVTRLESMVSGIFPKGNFQYPFTSGGVVDKALPKFTKKLLLVAAFSSSWVSFSSLINFGQALFYFCHMPFDLHGLLNERFCFIRHSGVSMT
jgi:hypothetical protein